MGVFGLVIMGVRSRTLERGLYVERRGCGVTGVPISPQIELEVIVPWRRSLSSSLFSLSMFPALSLSLFLLSPTHWEPHPLCRNMYDHGGQIAALFESYKKELFRGGSGDVYRDTRTQDVCVFTISLYKAYAG